MQAALRITWQWTMEHHGGACMVLIEHGIQSTPSLTVMHEECAKDWQQHMKNTHTAHSYTSREPLACDDTGLIEFTVLST